MTNEGSIVGVQVFPVTTIPDERGMVIKMPKPSFEVRDVYTTTVRHGAIKAWHGYTSKILFYTVVSGLVKLVLIDQRDGSPSYGVIDEIFLGEGAMNSVQIPHGVFNGFKGISQNDAIIVVQANEDYGQITRLPINYFYYDWMWKNG